MRRPLEELVDGGGQARRAATVSARVKVGGLSETATLGAAFNEMAGRAASARPASATSSTG